MECPECQFENREGVKFCEKCGNKIEIVCSNCGAKIPPDRQFCGECGHKLSIPSTVSIPKELSFDEKLDKIQRYLPNGLTERILAQRGRIEGERKQVTVMFCDMENYSQISETIGPEKVYDIMDEVYEILIHKVHDYEGTVNEMTGDGIIALFGAPIALEDAPQRAIRSALSIHREMAKLSEELKHKKQGIPFLKMRIGIHTGPVVVGTLGNDLRVEFKAVGDTVNLASRVEGLAEPGTTCVSGDTYRLTEGLFHFEYQGKKEVKGKLEPVNVYRVIAPSSMRTRFDVSTDRGLTPFVGRERELELLLDCFERAKEGRGQACSIMAEAGVGKSRLLYEFRKAVANKDVTFLEGKCLSYNRGVPYHLPIDILKANFDIREGESDLEIREKVKKGLRILGVDEASTLPYLLDLLSVKDSRIDPTIASNPELRKARIIDTFKLILLKGSEIRPLVLAHEDLHWIDNSSEDLLKNTLRSIPGARVFFIFTYRPEFVPTWGGKSFHSQVTLNRLSNRESLAMVAHILGTEDMERDLEELILEKTEGIPFFIEEFLKSLKDLKIIDRKEYRYCLTKDIKDLVIPSAIQDVIMARVDSLPEDGKSVLQTGSVVGREFNQDLMELVTGLSDRILLSHLSLLKDAELLYERGIYPQSTYIFKHALIQEVAYNSLLVKRRSEIHLKIGKAIETLYTDRLEEFYEMLAFHYLKSEDLEKAYQYLKLSGDKATNNYANNEALNFYHHALEVLHKIPETLENKKRQVGLRMTMWPALESLGFPEGSLDILIDGKKIAEEIGDKRSLIRTYGKLGNYYTVMGNKVEAIEYSAKSFDEAEKNEDIDLIVPIGFELSLSNFQYGDIIKAIDIASKVIQAIEDNKRESDFFGRPFNTYAEMNSHCGLSIACLGKLKEGEMMCKKSLRFAKDIEHLPSIGSAEHNLSIVFSLKGDGKNALKHSEEAMKCCREAGVDLLLPLNNTYLGISYYLLGELQTASQILQKALQIQKDMGLQMFMSFIYIGLGLVDMELGNLKCAQSNAEKGLGFAQKNSERLYEGWAWTLFGRIQGKKEPAEFYKAEECIMKGIKMFEEIITKPYLFQGYLYLGDLYNDMGRKDEALKYLKMAEGMFKEVGMDYYLAKTQEVLEKV